MLENSVYSVISPEGCASILWKDASRAPEAAECLKLTAQDLVALGIAERIIAEEGKAFSDITSGVRGDIALFLENQKKKSVDELLAKRYERFRKIQ